MDKLLEVNNLRVSFFTTEGEVQAVRGVDFYVRKGECLSIVGESGSGKSVTTQTILQLIQTPPGKIKDGEIIFEGENLLEKTEEEMNEIRGKEISIIFQDPMSSLNPIMTIGSQITEILRRHFTISHKSAIERAVELLELVGVPEPKKRIHQYPHEFSGGMCQRVMIAIALATNPKLLIADEPTTALDVSVQEQILNLLKDLQERLNLSIIFITHDLGVVAKISDRFAVMYAGKIVEYGDVYEIFKSPVHPYTKGLLASIPNPEKSGQKLYAIPGSPPNLINPPVGDAFAIRNPDALKIDFEKEPPMFKISDNHFAATWLLSNEVSKVKAHTKSNQKKLRKDTSSVAIEKNEKKEVILEIKNLKKYFNPNTDNEIRAIDDISLEIYKGETLGLVGESGSGKSTVGRTLIGLHDMTEGEVRFKGKNIKDIKRKDLARNMQMVFQDPYSSLNPRMTSGNAISEGVKHHKILKKKQDILDEVYRLLDIVDLDKIHINRYPHEFSGGQRQRIGIARSLSLNPEFVIADEAISALDASIQAQIVNLLKQLQMDNNLTFLFIAHDFSMVRYISDRIAVMLFGKIVEVADSDELFNNPLHPYTKLLLSAVPVPNPLIEKSRVMDPFDKETFSKNYNNNTKLHEIHDNHFVLCTKEEIQYYSSISSNKKKINNIPKLQY